ncbi:thymidine phosphorylase [Paenibacillaceae bacterium]|nr:thymidine phosphorylase [Paenibacillaceae bacterium]
MIEITDNKIYAIYIRVSTDKQVEHGDSIEMQQSLGEKIILENEGILYKIYIEPAVSASKTKLKDRKILLECLSDAKAGYFNKLIVYRRDRLSRKAEDSLAIRSILESAKCEIIFSATGEMQVNLNDPYGKLMENIRASLDEIESATISMRVSDVMRSKAEKGEFGGGTLPYGYIRTDKGIVVSREDVPIIYEIEDLYLKGYGIYSIVKWLNGGEIRNLGFRPNGKAIRRLKQHKNCSELWTKDVVHNVIFSKFYSGYVEYGGKGSEKEIIAKGLHEAIRSEERQQLINSKRDLRVSKITPPRHYQTNFLLTGLLFCGECGLKYISRNSTRKNKKPYLYYYCSSSYNRNAIRECNNHNFKKDIIEEFIIQKIKEYIKTVDINNLTDKIEKQLIKNQLDDKVDLEKINKGIRRLEKSKESIKRLLFELDEQDENYLILKKEYQEDQIQLIKELNEANRVKEIIMKKTNEKKDDKITYDEILRNMKSFLDMFDKLPQISQKVLLDTIIDKIEIFKDGEIQCQFAFDTGYNGKEEDIEVEFMSLGGTSDKVTLVVAPLVAAVGVPVAKMSGRGLGHTGGTIDKLEAIQGFQTELSRERFIEQVNEIGVAVIGQSGDLTPADKKLYALRDVTATVESIPLIASSIMSKKIASGADSIVLDVKVGDGAFMKTLAEAEALAEAMVAIGSELGRRTAAVISDMNQPLGFAIGNALEVAEALTALQGEGPSDLMEVSLTLGAHMVVLGGKADTLEEARALVEQKLMDGSALRLFHNFVKAQGGNEALLEHPERVLPQAKMQIRVPAPSTGIVQTIAAEQLGIAAMKLGAGRASKDDQIDHAVGLVLSKKAGDRVKAGDTIATVHAQADNAAALEAVRTIQRAYTIEDKDCERRPLILSVVTTAGTSRL